jgi:hypothetical protein
VKVYHFPKGPGTGQYLMLASDLIEAPVVHTGEWQTIKTEGSPMHATHELEDVSLVWDQMPEDLNTMIPAIDLVWANEHFRERVSGQPLNPAPSHVRWPYAVQGNTMHVDADARFDHTYPERFWPKHAGHRYKVPQGPLHKEKCRGIPGVRFHYGDLSDVVNLLVKSPLTRQAFLPVWFPEDTGAVEGQRVPCTLGYHFMQRGGLLSCRYYLRSCDLYRHMSNDVFFAAMLTKWVTDQVWEHTRDQDQKVSMRPGGLAMHISSLHAFKGDTHKIKDRINQVSMDDDADGVWAFPA